MPPPPPTPAWPQESLPPQTARHPRPPSARPTSRILAAANRPPYRPPSWSSSRKSFRESRRDHLNLFVASPNNPEALPQSVRRAAAAAYSTANRKPRAQSPACGPSSICRCTHEGNRRWPPPGGSSSPWSGPAPPNYQVCLPLPQLPSICAAVRGCCLHGARSICPWPLALRVLAARKRRCRHSSR
jgi:hypothetical protein